MAPSQFKSFPANRIKFRSLSEDLLAFQASLILREHVFWNDAPLRFLPILNFHELHELQYEYFLVISLLTLIKLVINTQQ